MLDCISESQFFGFYTSNRYESEKLTWQILPVLCLQKNTILGSYCQKYFTALTTTQSAQKNLLGNAGIKHMYHLS